MNTPDKIHESITEEKVMELVEESMFGAFVPGLCLNCGDEITDGIEPDAEDYPCENCGENFMNGVEQIMHRGNYNGGEFGI